MTMSDTPIKEAEVPERLTGRWLDGSGLGWFVHERPDGGIIATSDRCDFTTANAATFARWRKDHGWTRAALAEEARP